jgi:hypothetical protein
MQTPADRPALIPQSLDRGVALMISGIFIIALVVVTIGLWLFRPWGRSGYVVLLLLCVISMFFASPSVLPAPAFACAALNYFIQGALIAMAFLPPVAQLFSTPKV